MLQTAQDSMWCLICLRTTQETTHYWRILWSMFSQMLCFIVPVIYISSFCAFDIAAVPNVLVWINRNLVFLWKRSAWTPPLVSGSWIFRFSGRPQSVRIGKNTLCWVQGCPQGCVLAPLLMHDCTWRHEGNLFIKCADDTAAVGLVCKDDETMSREDEEQLEGWCRDSNLAVSVDKTEKVIIDFWMRAPLSVSGCTAEGVKQTLMSSHGERTSLWLWNGPSRDRTFWGN